MMLYYRPTCPYCVQVIHFMQHEGIHIELRNIEENRDYYAELLSRGGKGLVPFLFQENPRVAIYESEEIITYLQEQYGQK